MASNPDSITNSEEMSQLTTVYVPQENLDPVVHLMSTMVKWRETPSDIREIKLFFLWAEIKSGVDLITCRMDVKPKLKKEFDNLSIRA